MLELYCGKLPDEQRLSNPENMRPQLLNNRHQPIEVFSHCHSFQTSFGFLDRLPLQPCLRSRKVYQGGRDEGHLQTVTVQSPWNKVSCSQERPYVGLKYCINGDLCIIEIRSEITKNLLKIISLLATYFVYASAQRQKPSRNTCYIFRKQGILLNF